MRGWEVTEVWLIWVGFYRQVMHLGGGVEAVVLLLIGQSWASVGRMTCSCGISCTWGG